MLQRWKEGEHFIYHFYHFPPMWKSIKIKEDTKRMLDELKIHPRQSYNEVIRELIEKCK
ncbi:MAG: hypothetical protein U9O89_02085 [Thermoproteota archaeon]|nr:hypothetical protein [Thermoproteota archaeon]